MADISEPISHRTNLISCNAQIKSEARSILKNVNGFFQSNSILRVESESLST